MQDLMRWEPDRIMAEQICGMAIEKVPCPDERRLRDVPLAKEEIASYHLESGAGIIRFFATDQHTAFSNGALAIWQDGETIKTFVFVTIKGTVYVYPDKEKDPEVWWSRHFTPTFPDCLLGRPLSRAERDDLSALVRMTIMRSVITDIMPRVTAFIWWQLYDVPMFDRIAVHE